MSAVAKREEGLHALSRLPARSLAPEFIRPLPLLAVALLAVNDHLLKSADLLPGWLTGKISDFAGLFFFPLFLSALLGIVLRRGPSVRRITACAAVSALLFTLLQLSPDFAVLYLWAHRGIAPFFPFALTPDPSDLLALPMAGLSILYGRRGVARRGLLAGGHDGVASPP